MIELNKKTQQDFLNRKWVQRLLDAGVDMSDAKYCIGKGISSGIDYVLLRTEADKHYTFNGLPVPTYTVSELLYKLHEYIYPTIEGKEYAGPLTLLKDAPFYIFYYRLKHETDKSVFIDENYIYASCEYPIESLASLLIQCHNKGEGDTGNISDK